MEIIFQNKIKEYSEFLKNNISELDRLDIGYGKSGVLIFHLYKSKLFKELQDIEFSKYLFELIIEEISLSKRKTSTIELVEVLYLISFFKGELSRFYELQGLIDQMENIIEETTKKVMQNNNFDGYAGAGYILNYFLLNKKSLFLDDFINFLEFNLQITEYGDHYINLDPKYYKTEIQLGITHGISFVINILSKYHQLFPENKKIIYLAEGFVKFIIRQKQSFNEYGCYFNDVVGIKGFTKLNLAYGDIGILHSLLTYSKIFRREDIYKEIISCIITQTKRKTEIETGINNSSILYGASGVFLFYKNLQGLDDNMNLNNEALFWKKRVEELLLKDENSVRISDSSFFEGNMGALVILMSIELKDYRYLPLFYLC